jgi:hypothetical protein
MHCAAKGHLDCMRVLLKHGADMNAYSEVLIACLQLSIVQICQGGIL